jgi:hypothetical protein
MQNRTMELGDLICALYEEALATTTHRSVAARLAAIATLDLLLRNRNLMAAARLQCG